MQKAGRLYNVKVMGGAITALLVMSCAAGCQRAPADGTVVARRAVYIGSTWQRWLVIRRPDGTRVEQAVRADTWRHCQTGRRYPGCTSHR